MHAAKLVQDTWYSFRRMVEKELSKVLNAFGLLYKDMYF